MLRYIIDNAKWCTNKQYFVHLLGTGMSTEELDNNLCELSARYRQCTSSDTIDVNSVRFALNDIAMWRAKQAWGYQLQSLMPTYWSMFVAVSGRLSGVKFPSCNGTRLSAVVQLYVSATQNHNDPALWARYIDRASSMLQLTPRELAYISDVYLLYRCMYYCAVCRNIAQTQCMQYLDRLTNAMPLVGTMVDSNRYSTMSYDRAIQSVVDCFGTSRVVLGANKIDSSMSIDISANSRNILDTFCSYLYGDNMALYKTNTNSISATMRYRVVGNCEIRTIDIVANSRSRQRYVLNANCVVQQTKGCSVESLVINNCPCVCVSGAKQYYVAYVMVDSRYNLLPADGVVDNGNGVNLQLSYSATLDSRQSMHASIVSIYGDSLRDITSQLDRISTIGYCDMLPFCCQVAGGTQYDIVTNIAPCSNMYQCANTTHHNKLHNYTYQFGDSGVSTLLDNLGNSITLLDGFAFGTEKIYYYNANKIVAVNCGKFAIDANGFSYNHTIGAIGVELSIAHRHAKVYSANIASGGLLFVLPLEQYSQVVPIECGFEITSNSRHFVVRYTGKLDSFTTNSIECSSTRLRRHLSGNISAGDSLVMSFAGSAEVEIVNCNKLPIGRAVVGDSLLSTYLNYINNKNIYLTINKLRPVDPLILASMVYTNMNYVWQHLLNMEQQCTCDKGTSYYYDSSRQMVGVANSMTYPLALLYYVLVSGNSSVLTPERISRLQYMLYDSSLEGKQLCLVALALKKLSKLNIDKVNVLIQYSNAKKVITNNKELYSYAQAIGAVPMVNASKQRLKSLVAKNNIPKCFYYVSQLENLYGIELVSNKLTIKPKVGATALEQLLLHVGNKHINTQFDSASSYSLHLNGTEYYSGIELSEVSDNNTLVVGCS